MPRHAKKNGRKSRSGDGRVVTSLSASQFWDRKLATAKDACRVSDRIALGAFTVNSGGTFSFGSPLSPAVSNGTSSVAGLFGQRVFTLGGNFLRYRINRLLACYRPIVGTNVSGLAGLGFLDDVDVSTTAETVASIQELRCSHSDSIYREIEVEWRPVDPGCWYYFLPDNGRDDADSRLQWPGSLVFGVQYTSASIVVGQIDLYYDITFEGASDPNGGGL